MANTRNSGSAANDGPGERKQTNSRAKRNAISDQNIKDYPERRNGQPDHSKRTKCKESQAKRGTIV